MLYILMAMLSVIKYKYFNFKTTTRSLKHLFVKLIHKRAGWRAVASILNLIESPCRTIANIVLKLQMYIWYLIRDSHVNKAE